MKNKNLLPEKLLKPSSCLITVFENKLLYKSVELSSYLRKINISSEIYPDDNTKLDKQLKYADKKGIPFVLIIGPSEIRINKVKLKNMKTGEQSDVSIEDLPKILC